ncbi:unnamed protein product [Mytilus coruscus]|uniref:Uncharacterized protein n=1 Tax=Mytilus coruscus TaxID=42192 RepID=A0A6J8CRZ9_MYTCO|nr:unnamed protein product [Mytilus coruscus]
MKTTYNTNICFLTQIIQPFLFIQYVRSLQLTCPDVSQWNIRAKGFCNNAKPSYYCLFDKNSLYYKEFCRHKEDFHQSGNKYIVRGDIDGEPCEKTRYQPFKFRTEGNSKCIFQKSACSEDGQIIHNNGNTTSDITCRCDYTRGYGFVIKPKHTCFCYPTEEDCSCYKKKCNTNELLNPNYECETHLTGDFNCMKIKTRWTIEITSTVQTRPTVIPSSFLELTGFKVMIHQALLVILIIFLPMAFLSVVFIRFIKWSLQKCSKYFYFKFELILA